MNNETLTCGIKHLAESANFKVGTFNKPGGGSTGKCIEMPNVSYRSPLWLIVKKEKDGLSCSKVFDELSAFTT